MQRKWTEMLSGYLIVDINNPQYRPGTSTRYAAATCTTRLDSLSRSLVKLNN